MPSNQYPKANAVRPTAREIVILEYLVQDLTNAQIGLRMKLSEQTIKTYMRRLISLTKVNSRLGLATTFVRWLELGQSNPHWDEPDIVYAQIGGRGNGQS